MKKKIQKNTKFMNILYSKMKIENEKQTKIHYKNYLKKKIINKFKNKNKKFLH